MYAYNNMHLLLKIEILSYSLSINKSVLVLINVIELHRTYVHIMQNAAAVTAITNINIQLHSVTMFSLRLREYDVNYIRSLLKPLDFNKASFQHSLDIYIISIL